MPDARPTRALVAVTALAALAVALVALAPSPAAAPADAPGAEHAPAVDPPDFEDVAAERGLDVPCEGWNKELGLSPRSFTDAFFCPTPAIADVNGDGHLDVFFVNHRYPNATFNEEQDPQNRLLLNQGDGTFRDVTDLIGVHDTGFGMAGAALDAEGDGDLDLYVANFASRAFGSPATTFYENHGDGTFTASSPPGLETASVVAPDGGAVPDNMFGSATAVADYDRDGDLDVYRGNYAKYFVEQSMPASLQNTDPESNLLFENQGDGTFEDVTTETGASQQAGRTFAVNFVDLNQDGWPDLYVANDENPNELYLNRPGEAPGERVFEHVTGTTAADDRGAMCSTAADWNNDGNLDLYMTHYENEHNGYYLGNGDGTFADAEGLGDLDQGYHMLGWGCPAVDVDNDGDRDLFVANGHMTPTGGEFFHTDSEAEQLGFGPDDNGYALPNQLFVNTLEETGTHSFVEASEAAGPAFEVRRSTSGAQAADLDRDGQAEILAVNNNAEAMAYLDRPDARENRYLSVDLRGAGANTHAIGARVTVEAGDHTLVEHRTTGGSLASGSVLPIRAGLGHADGPATVTVEWPSGQATTHTVALDQHVRIHEDRGVAYDTRAPRVDVNVTPTPSEASWVTEPAATVRLDATDPGPAATGVDTLEVRVDDGPAQPYEGPITVTGEGEHVLRVLVEDAAGNKAWYPHPVHVDTQDPDAAITQPEGETIRVQGQAAPHGEAVLFPPVGHHTGAGAHADGVVAGWAGEAAIRSGVGVPYPDGLAENLAGTAGDDGRTPVRVDASDAASGLDRAVFAVDGDVRHTDQEAPFAWDADLRGLDHGEHTLTVTVFDEAGRETTRSRTVEVVPTSAAGLAATDAEDLEEAQAPDPQDARPAAAAEALLAGLPNLGTAEAEPSAEDRYFNGVGSYLPANERDAPIFRQLNFIDDDQGGTLGQYVVLNPDTFLTSPQPSNIYQFPACENLDPVLDPPLHQPRPSGGEPVAWDRPMRQIVNVELEGGCEQPRSVEEVEERAAATVETGTFVNAPKLPEQVEDWPDQRLFNAPPYRPRIDAYQGGEPVRFITYEASWIEPWVGTKMPGENDVFIVSTTSTFREGFTLFNVNIGAPNHHSFNKYSPIWKGKCVVAEDNQKCMISVNKRAGFEQPHTIEEILTLEADDGTETRIRSPNTFTHINCPYVAIDTDGDDFVDPHEELFFPNLWVDGPVEVA